LNEKLRSLCVHILEWIWCYIWVLCLCQFLLCAVEDEQFSAQTHDFVNAKDYFGRYGTFLCLCPVMTYGLFSTVEWLITLVIGNNDLMRKEGNFLWCMIFWICKVWVFWVKGRVFLNEMQLLFIKFFC